MSRSDFVKSPALPGGNREVKIEVTKSRRNTYGPTTAVQATDNRGIAKVSSRSSDYVFVNSAFVGSVTSVSGQGVNTLPEPPTSVIREQYWACSKWPFAQKVLALSVGILLGAVIALSISYALTGMNADEVIGGIFRSVPARE